MANFIEKTLEPGEKVIFKGRLHWSYNFRYTAWGILLIVLSVAGMVVVAYTHYNDFNNNMLALFCLCVVVCLVGIGLIGCHHEQPLHPEGWYLRHQDDGDTTLQGGDGELLPDLLRKDAEDGCHRIGR